MTDRDRDARRGRDAHFFTDRDPGSGANSDEELFRDAHANEHTPDPSEDGGVDILSSDERNYDTEYYERLDRRSRRTNPNFSTKLCQEDKARIAHSICNALDLTEWQRDRALQRIESLDLDAFGNQKRIEKVALAVIKQVVNQDRAARFGPEFDRITEKDVFRELMESHGMDHGDLMRVSGNVKKELAAGPSKEPGAEDVEENAAAVEIDEETEAEAEDIVAGMSEAEDAADE